MKIAIIIGSVVLGLLFLLFITLLLLYIFIFYSPLKGQISNANLLGSTNYQNYVPKVQLLIKNLMVKEYEDVYITSFDKLKLHARLFKNNSHKVAILCHGYRGASYRDFSGGATELINLNYNVILIDQRGHGLSKGHSITFGVRETKDLLSWIKFAKERFNKDMELILVGVSMGAHTVLNIADKVDKNIKIIADCPYSSPKAILCNSIKSVKLPVWLFYPLVNLSSIIFTHENMNKTSAYNSIRNSDNKILIVHGDKDSVIPYTDSQTLADSFKDKIQYELFPDADHGMSYVVDTERYQKIIRDFLR